jgi:hypothetical protein
VPCVVSALKSGAVSLIRGTLEVTVSRVAVLMFPPQKSGLRAARPSADKMV